MNAFCIIFMFHVYIMSNRAWKEAKEVNIIKEIDSIDLVKHID